MPSAADRNGEERPEIVTKERRKIDEVVNGEDTRQNLKQEHEYGRIKKLVGGPL